MKTRTWTRHERATVAGSGLTALALGVLPIGCTGDEFTSCGGSECIELGTAGAAGADDEATSSGGAGGANGWTTTSTNAGGRAGSGGGGAGGGSGGAAGDDAGAGGTAALGTVGTGSGTGAGGTGVGGTGTGGTAPTSSCEDTCDGTCCGELCVDLESDLGHCGICGLSCSLDEAEAACVAGTCVVAECNDDAVDCNGVASDGCERRHAGIPEAPGLTRPMLGAFTGSLHARDETGSLRPRFVWTEVEPVTCDVVTYQLQVDDSCDFSKFAGCDFPSPELDVNGVRTETFTPEVDLPVEEAVAPLGRRYYWRVRACEAAMVCSEWSEVFYVDVGRTRDDVTGDGYPDVVGITEDDQLFIARGRPDFYNDGEAEILTDATFYPEVQLRFLGDVDGDGFNDVGGLVRDLARRAESSVVWRGAAAGLVLPEIVVGSAAWIPGRPGGVWPAGDYNRDGYADLVLLHRRRPATATVFTLKPGSQLLGEAVEQEQPMPGALIVSEEAVRSVASGDFNGDGHVDQAVDVGAAQTDVAFILGGPERSGPFVFKGSAPSEGCRPILATVDFNGDDIDDVAVLCRAAGRLTVILGRRDFVPDELRTESTSFDGPREDIAVGDLDNSGIDDLIVSDGIVFWGAEARPETEDWLATVKAADPIVLGDHDADGDQDIMRAHHWYRGMVTPNTWDTDLSTSEGESLTVIALAR